jgi:hypothetical protein
MEIKDRIMEFLVYSLGFFFLLMGGLSLYADIGIFYTLYMSNEFLTKNRVISYFLLGILGLFCGLFMFYIGIDLIYKTWKISKSFNK